MSSKQNEDSAFGSNNLSLRPLTQEELSSFREDYRELEREIQSFFRVYYLSGLILVAAWVTSSQSKPLLELAIGNGGYNIYAPIAIAGLNMVSTIFLLYKGILIHDISQFMSFLSDDDSAYNYWETWRRNRRSAEYYARRLYAPLLVIVPLLLSGFTLYFVYNIVCVDSQTLAHRMQQSQPQLSAVQPNTAIGTMTTVIPQDVLRKAYAERRAFEESKNIEEREAYIQKISPVLGRAKIWFGLTSILHLVPLFLIFLSTSVTERQWARIRNIKGGETLFKGLNRRLYSIPGALFIRRLKRKEDKTHNR